MSFRLRNVPLLSRVGADRADALRTDIDAAVAGWPDALLLRVDRRNQVLISGGQAVLNDARDAGDAPPRSSSVASRTAGTSGGSVPSCSRLRAHRSRCWIYAAPAMCSTTSAPNSSRPPPRC